MCLVTFTFSVYIYKNFINWFLFIFCLFLEKHKLNLFAVTQDKKLYRTDGTYGYDIKKVFVGWSTSNSYEEFKSVREAIDVAIKEVNYGNNS